jgi:hypothetical protein
MAIAIEPAAGRRGIGGDLRELFIVVAGLAPVIV